jgi:hypothetical protein
VNALAEGPDKEPGSKCTVEHGAWRVTIEHFDVWQDTFEELMEVVMSALQGSGWMDETLKEYFSE